MVQDVSYVIFPAINSLKSTLSSGDEQGQVLGAVNAVQSLGTGLGPFIFNWVFANSLRAGHPSAVWWVGALFTAVSVVLAFLVPDHRRHAKQLDGKAGGGIEVLLALLAASDSGGGEAAARRTELMGFVLQARDEYGERDPRYLEIRSRLAKMVDHEVEEVPPG